MSARSQGPITALTEHATGRCSLMSFFFIVLTEHVTIALHMYSIKKARQPGAQSLLCSLCSVSLSVHESVLQQTSHQLSQGAVQPTPCRFPNRPLLILKRRMLECSSCRGAAMLSRRKFRWLIYLLYVVLSPPSSPNLSAHIMSDGTTRWKTRIRRCFYPR